MQYRLDGGELSRRMVAAGFVTDATPAIRAFAQACGMTDTAVRNYLRGKRIPGGPQLVSMVAVLGCDIWDLLVPVGEEVAS